MVVLKVTIHYAQEQLASMGRPCQYLLFVKPGIGVTAEYLVNLEEDA